MQASFRPASIDSTWATTASGRTSRTTAKWVWIIALALMTVFLRAWNIGAIFESSDQVAMAHMVRHSYGIQWIFAHDYAPVLPFVQRAFAEVLSLAHWAINEAAARFPIMLVSLCQVAMTYVLLRRIGRPQNESLIGATCCAILPSLATDSHYAWGVYTIWLFMGTVAFWATLTYIDERRWWYLALAAIALFTHCLSSLYSFALPLTLMAAWWLAWNRGHSATRPSPGALSEAPSKPQLETSRSDSAQRRVLWPAIVSFVMPCIAALAIIVLAWLWTGKGQIGRILGKQDMGMFGLHLEQIPRFPELWLGQMGAVFGLISALGLIAGVIHMSQGDRRGLLAVWAWNGLWPTLLLTDWRCTGVPQGYIFEVTYAAGLLGVFLLCAAYRSWRRGRPVAVAAAALAGLQLALGSLCVCVPGTGLERITGMVPGWGSVRVDTGIKAAGWYTREHIPENAIIMSLHTNAGMELPVAEYYLGRRVVAGYDNRPEMLEPLLRTMRDDVDVLIVEARHQALADTLTELEPVCTFRNKTEPVRYVYARPTLGLPRIDQEASVLNERYDRQYHPRKIPIPLPAAKDLLPRLKKYQIKKKELQQKWRQQQAPLLARGPTH